MTTILIICVIGALAAVLLLRRAGKHFQTQGSLNDDDLIMLDAEALSAGGLVKACEQEIVAELGQITDAPALVQEVVDREAPSYSVISQSVTYPIFFAGMDISQGQHWGIAAFGLFDIVNRQLTGTP